MIYRNILKELKSWRNSRHRKPLIIRGARQTGKTTVVREFGKTYAQFIYLNLERKEDAALFQSFPNFAHLVSSIFFHKDKNPQSADTLIFIDEIQEVPEAINLLRYFYEDVPQYHVIAAGSLLETILTENITMPVGRVQFMVLRPLSFDEYLDAMGEHAALEQYHKTPMDDFAHSKLLELFHNYALIGGMPEMVNHYAENRNLTALTPIYESLLLAYMNDVEKYARNHTMVQVIRHVMKSMGPETGNRIKFEKFGHSNYGSREVGEAMRIMEKAMLLSLIYPCTSTSLPVFADKKKSPRLQLLDTGLLNYLAGIQKEVLGAPTLEHAFQGKLAEHIVGQELLAKRYGMMSELHFWTRERKDAEAEIDFIHVEDAYLIPVEVKSGATGRLRSLHQFMETAPHHTAVRFYGGPISRDSLTTPSGKAFQLLSLPYYLAGRISAYLQNQQ
jgi:uncharacterized protein